MNKVDGFYRVQICETLFLVSTEIARLIGTLHDCIESIPTGDTIYLDGDAEEFGMMLRYLRKLAKPSVTPELRKICDYWRVYLPEDKVVEKLTPRPVRYSVRLDFNSRPIITDYPVHFEKPVNFEFLDGTVSFFPNEISSMDPRGLLRNSTFMRDGVVRVPIRGAVYFQNRINQGLPFQVTSFIAENFPSIQ